MAKVVACIIARTVSTRLPLKVLRDFAPHLGMLDFMIQNILSKNVVDEVYLCTSTEPVDDILEDVAQRNKVKIYRGCADEVIERMLSVGEIEHADILIRITGDNPFTAIEFIKHQVQVLLENNLDYVRVTDLPVGATAEVFTYDALKRCNELMDPKISEYLMLYIFEPRHFSCGVIKAYEADYSTYSLTVDRPEDLVRAKNILAALGFNGDYSKIQLKDILDILLRDGIYLPGKTISPSGEVKLPLGKVISYQEFKHDMDRRIQQSTFIKLYE